MLMLVLVFLGTAAAAPHYNHDFRQRYSDVVDRHPSFGREFFDPNRFWVDFEKEMHQLDDMMKLLHTHFPGAQSTAKVVGNQYVVTVPLSDFVESDIVVKARDGSLMIQASHKSEDGIARNYLDVRSMPDFVDSAGVWTYENEVLTITFPLKGQATTLPSVTNGDVETVTEGFNSSTEEIERTDDSKDESHDADVGASRNDLDIKTNEISKVPVEATTYAVDLKNQYEFVTVAYKK